ncbi:MAG: glycosyltransferase family 2 protein, partial [Vicinamibacterales bacterium]
LDTCLAHLQRQTRPADRVIVVDNASTDGSADPIAAGRRGVEVIRLATNAGFAAANNLGIRHASDCDAVALLNPDAFPEPQWLASLCEAARAHVACASFGSQMVGAHAPDVLDGIGDVFHVSGLHWRAGYRRPRSAVVDCPREIFSACAAAALYRRDAVLDAGGFDDAYFCYSEDVDLGFRLRLLGYGCRYVPGAVVRHVGSAASGTGSDFSVYHGHRNMVWTFVKDMPGPLFWQYLPQHVLTNALSVLWFILTGRGRAIVRAKIGALRGLRGAWRQRRAIQARRTVSARSVRAMMDRRLVGCYTSRRTMLPRAGDAAGRPTRPVLQSHGDVARR